MTVRCLLPMVAHPNCLPGLADHSGGSLSGGWRRYISIVGPITTTLDVRYRVNDLAVAVEDVSGRDHPIEASIAIRASWAHG